MNYVPTLILRVSTMHLNFLYLICIGCVIILQEYSSIRISINPSIYLTIYLSFYTWNTTHAGHICSHGRTNIPIILPKNYWLLAAVKVIIIQFILIKKIIELAILYFSLLLPIKLTLLFSIAPNKVNYQC